MATVGDLNDGTLVLNRGWRAIHVTTVKRALGLIIRDVAGVLGPDDYDLHDLDSWCALGNGNGHPVIRSPSMAIRQPEVIVLRRYDGLPIRRVPLTRRNVQLRDGGLCQYCGRPPGAGRGTVDHVLPVSRGGRNVWDNVVLACSACNRRKGGRTPEEACMRLQRPAKRPRWTPVHHVPPARRKESWGRFLGGLGVATNGHGTAEDEA